MVNILLDLVNERGFNSKAVRKIKENIPQASVYMIAGTPEEVPTFEELGECILRDNTARGIYRKDQIDMKHCIPIDEELLEYMNSHSLEIMHQQRRFEGYRFFSIEPTLESHYTVYMHNLFFWYNFLQQRNITHVFLFTVPHEGYDCMIYYLCKYLDIPIQMIYVGTMQDRRYPFKDIRYVDTELLREYERLKEQYRDTAAEDIPLESEAKLLFERWSSKEPDQMKPWYMRVDPFKRRLRTRCDETNIFRIWRGILGPDYVKYGLGMKFIGASIKKSPQLLGMVPVAAKRWRVVKPLKKSSLELHNFYESLAEEPVEGEKYVYFPLHFQPEASSNPLGGDMYADHMIPLHILSKALPETIKIYVKEHPEQLALMRTKEYYQDMLRIPGVRLIKQISSTYDLMKNAVAVSTLTGTAMWECQFFGVPAIVFGYSLKNMAPLSYPVRTVEECKKAIEHILANPERNMLKELKIYTKAMYNQSFPADELENALPVLITNFVNGREDVLEGVAR